MFLQQINKMDNFRIIKMFFWLGDKLRQFFKIKGLVRNLRA